MLKFKKSGSKHSRCLQVRRFIHRCSWEFQCSGIWSCVPVFWNMMLCSRVLEYDDVFQCYGIWRCVPVFWNMKLCSSVLEYDAVFQCSGIRRRVPVFWNMSLCSSVLEYDVVFQCPGIWHCGSRCFERKFRLHLENFRVREECTFMELEPLKIRRQVPPKRQDPLTWRSSATS